MPQFWLYLGKDFRDGVFEEFWIENAKRNESICSGSRGIALRTMAMRHMMCLFAISSYLLQRPPNLLAKSKREQQMVPRGLEPRTLRLLAVRSNQLSYETLTT